MATIRICTIEGCESRSTARGMCDHHYHQARNSGLERVNGYCTGVCDAPGCESQDVTKGLCELHYSRMKRTGGLETTRARRICSVDGCDSFCSGRGWCRKHYMRAKRRGWDLNAPLRNTHGSGPESRGWKGDDVGYASSHSRVRRLRGSARDLQCIICGQPAAHWAYDHLDVNEKVDVSRKYEGLVFSVDPDHYQPMCVPCHADFDAKSLTNIRSE